MKVLRKKSLLSIVFILVLSCIVLFSTKSFAAHGKTIVNHTAVTSVGSNDPEGAIFDEQSASFVEKLDENDKPLRKATLMYKVSSDGWNPNYRITFEWSNGERVITSVNDVHSFEVPEGVKGVNNVQVVRSESDLTRVSKNSLSSTYSWFTKASVVEVQHLDEISKKTIAPTELIRGYVYEENTGLAPEDDEKYSVFPLSEEQLNKMNYVYSKVSGSTNGTYPDLDYENRPVIKFYYKEEKGNVVVKYQDTNGKELAKDKVHSDRIGAKYDVSSDPYKINIKGYTFKEVTGPVDGRITRDSQEVVFVYTKDITSPTKPTNSISVSVPTNQTNSSGGSGNSNSNRNSGKTLPKTGSTSTVLLSFLGTSFITSGLYISLKDRKNIN